MGGRRRGGNGCSHMGKGEDQLERIAAPRPRARPGEGGQRLLMGHVGLGHAPLDLVAGEVDQLVILGQELIGDRQDGGEEVLPGDSGHRLGQLDGGGHLAAVSPRSRDRPIEDRIGQLLRGPFEQRDTSNW